LNGLKTDTKFSKDTNGRNIDEILKNGAVEFLCDDDGGKSDRFMSANIESILENSSKEVVFTETGYKDANEADLEEPSNKKSIFSQVKFVVDDSNEEIKIDDADFWEKALPKEKKRIGVLKDFYVSKDKLSKMQGPKGRPLREANYKKSLRILNEINDMEYDLSKID
jgi:hypothetical protein